MFLTELGNQRIAKKMDVNPIFRGRDFKVEKDLCFVLMPLHDPFTSIFEGHIKPVAKKCGLNAVKADDITSNKPVMEDVWKYLNKARLVIADLTDSNPNVFYELGIAHTLGKEVIMVSQHTTKVPFDVGHVRYIEYVYPSQAQSLESRLYDTISQVLKDSRFELRPKSTKVMSLELANPRTQRLNELVDWAKQWIPSNYPARISRLSLYGEGEWNIKEWCDLEIRNEAVKRWKLSDGTAKDYSDTVMLTVYPEFEQSIVAGVKKHQAELAAEEQRKERKRAVVSQAFEKLRNPFWGGDFVKLLIDSQLFSQEEAENELRKSIQVREIFEVQPGLGLYQLNKAFPLRSFTGHLNSKRP